MNNYTVTIQIDYQSPVPLSDTGKGALRNHIDSAMQKVNLDVRIAGVDVECVDVNVEDVA